MGRCDRWSGRPRDQCAGGPSAQGRRAGLEAGRGKVGKAGTDRGEGGGGEVVSHALVRGLRFGNDAEKAAVGRESRKLSSLRRGSELMLLKAVAGRWSRGLSWVGWAAASPVFGRNGAVGFMRPS